MRVRSAALLTIGVGLGSACGGVRSRASGAADDDGTTKLVVQRNHPRQVAVDDTNVFWTEAYGLGRIARDGGEWTLLAESPQPRALALTPSLVVWTDDGTEPTDFHDGSIRAIDKRGGPVLTIASSQHEIRGLAIDDAWVYWTAADPEVPVEAEVLRAPLSGGPSEVLVRHQLFPTGVAVDATSIYWAVPLRQEAPQEGGAILAAPKEGGEQRRLATTPQDAEIEALAVDASSVYWTASGALMRVAKAGGAPSTLATGQPRIGSIAIAGTSVYWTNEELEHGEVMVLDGDAKRPTRLAREQFLPTGLAAAGTRVFWAEELSGAVRTIGR